jgi:amino acid permease
LKDSAAFGARRFQEGDFVITGRRFELADAAERLIGRSAKTIYMILLSLYMYGLLWAYPSVFGRSFAGRVPTPFHDGKMCEDCDAQVRFWILIFGCVVVPMSCIDLEEQVVVQVTMSAGRLL